MQDFRQYLSHFYSEVFLLGFLLLSAQIVLIREFLLVYNGNELVIGILFAIWMLLTALGAMFGRYFKGGTYRGLSRMLLIIIALYPILASVGISYFRNTVFEPGRMISFYEIIYYSGMVLLPLCFSGGLAFNLMNISSEHYSGTLQDCYSYESLGSLAGGVLTSILFIFFLGASNFEILLYNAIFAFIFFGIKEYRIKRYFASLIYLMMTFGLMHLVYNYDLNLIAKKQLYPGQEVLITFDTPYGNLTLTRQHEQLNVFSDGQLMANNENIISREEDVHYALLQRQHSEKILVIGGLLSNISEELIKYSDVKKVTFSEEDERMVELLTFLNYQMDSNKMVLDFSDPVYNLKTSSENYDAVLINLPSPTSAKINRVYTLEFFELLDQKLRQGGVVSFRLPSSKNYLSDEELTLHASLYLTLKEVFTHVIVVPGNSYFFLASNQPLSLDYEDLLKDFPVQNKFINADYLNQELLKARSQKLMASYVETAPLNQNFHPVAYGVYIQFWLSHFGISFWLIPFLITIVLAAYLLLGNVPTTAMFVSGLTGAATELALIIAFQVLFGYVYLFIGVILTTFMAGLALGSKLSRACKMKQPLRMIYFLQLFSGMYIASVALTIFFSDGIGSLMLTKIIFMFMMFFVAALTGLQYGAAVCYRKQVAGNTVSEVYSADLVGSALGSLAIAIWIIPLLGIIESLIILSGLHFLTMVMIGLKRK